MMFVRFTKERYPNGYSRQDCEEQLQRAIAQHESLKRQVKENDDEIASLQRQLKQGGRREDN